MIISKTPYRISFFGGGTDYRDYFENYGGCVLSATIDKFSYVITREMPPFFDYKNRLTYSKIERFNSYDELEHPLVRNALKMLDINNIQITYDADLPARSGIGSSSSFAVGLLSCLYTLKGENRTKQKLAEDAIYLERELCRESGGVQDQIAVSFGGFNRLDFSSDGFSVIPLNIAKADKEALASKLMLFFTGFRRNSYFFAEKQNSRIKENTETLNTMKQYALDACKLLESGRLAEFGKLLDETWRLKKSLADGISNDTIDEVYSKAMKAGALGGKILGAGGGGFILFYVDEDKQQAVRDATGNLLQIPFSFEDKGTEIIHKGQ